MNLQKRIQKRVDDSLAELAVASATLSKAVKDGVSGEALCLLRSNKSICRGNLLNATAAAAACRKYPPMKGVSP